jgi:fructosamine-3-kinase
MNSSESHYERLLGRPVNRVAAVAGGDIGESVRIEMKDGSKYFAKRYPGGESSMSTAEAHGLDWLRKAGSLRVPLVIAASSDGDPLLVLEWIDQASRADRFDETLGRGLAALHQHGAPEFGLTANNYIGSLAQRNQPRESWSEFYARERIAPQAELARRAQRLPVDLDRSLERLIDTMSKHCGPEPNPARLHGDLWAGNLIADDRGLPCLIDPAVYGGHPEMDLAMMKLFGGFSVRVFDAYREVAPFEQDFGDRVALWQLYPLLVHLNLFGGSYLGRVAEVITRYV